MKAKTTVFLLTQKIAVFAVIFPFFLSSPASSLFAQDTTWHERMYLATGEYAPNSNWHAILRFEISDTLSSEPGSVQYTPDATMPVQQCLDDTVMLNFGHGVYVDETNNRLYLATIFTNQGNVLTTNTDTAVGSIAIFNNLSSITGAQPPDRHIFGDSTGLKQPHGCWLDESRDMLYVANAFGGNILVYENADSADGNIVPDRTIAHDSLGAPVFVYLDEMVDRLFVCAMPLGPGTKPQVLIYNNASTLNGTPDPDIRIAGLSTRLNLINSTVHNCWFNPVDELLAVGHHTNELLMFDLSGINWNPASTDVLDLAPRVIRVDDPSLGHDSTDVNLYGFFWDLETDRMFCSVGVDNPGGGPALDAPPNSVKVFDSISDSTVSGITIPSRFIYWDNGGTYYPPQPIWIEKYMIITGIEEKNLIRGFRLYPNPSEALVHLRFAERASDVNIAVADVTGKEIFRLEEKEILPGREFSIDATDFGSGLYVIRVSCNEGTWTGKMKIE